MKQLHFLICLGTDTIVSNCIILYTIYDVNDGEN